ncbi:MAG: type II 3-dehydroquinate dehydratase [Flavobacteriaceae bacterium]|nr:type II 3-dehydroquinate dehydratase [Flavobacteriaceae bacterium]
MSRKESAGATHDDLASRPQRTQPQSARHPPAAVYGSTTLADVEVLCREAGTRVGVDIDFRQSNHEGVLIDWIHVTSGRGRHCAQRRALAAHTARLVSARWRDTFCR